jgi:hypothetical protein
MKQKNSIMSEISYIKKESKMMSPEHNGMYTKRAIYHQLALTDRMNTTNECGMM